MVTTNSLSGETKCIQLSLFLLISLFCEKSLLMWRAQLHRMEPRGARRENSGAGRSQGMGSAALPETQPVGKGLPGSAPLSLHLGQGHGSASSSSCPSAKAAVPPAGDQGMDGSVPPMDESTIPRHSSPQRLCSCSGAAGTEQWVTHCGANKNCALALDGVGWHSPALCDEPRRLFVWDMNLYQLPLHCPSIEVSCFKYCIFQVLRFPIWFLQHIFHTILFQTSRMALWSENFSSLETHACKITPARFKLWMVCKVESFYWKQGQTNGKNNFKHILSLQGVKYVLGIIPIYTCILKQSRIQVRFDLLSAVEQSAHPIWGLDASKAFCYCRQPFQGKDVSPPPQIWGVSAECRCCSVSTSSNQRGVCWNPVACRGTCKSLTLYHLCVFSQKFLSTAAAVVSWCWTKHSQGAARRPGLHAKYQGLINIEYFSWCGYIGQHRCRIGGKEWLILISFNLMKIKKNSKLKQYITVLCACV